MTLQHYIRDGSHPLPDRWGGLGKTAVIYPAAFFCAFGFGLVSLGIVFHADDAFGASPTQIGALAATNAVAYIIGCLLVLPVASRLRPRHSIVAATLVMSAACVGLAYARSTPWLFAFQALNGAGTSIFWPPLMGWLSVNTEGKALNRTMGRFNLCWSGGLIVGPPLAGRLSQVGSEMPLQCAAVVYALTALMVTGAMGLLRGLSADDGAHAEERSAVGIDRTGTPLRFPSWLGLFSSYVVLAVVFNVFPVSARADLGLEKTTVGGLLFFRALFNTAVFVVLGRSSWWHFRSGQLMGGTLCFACALLSLAFVRSTPSLAVLLSAVGILMAHSYVNSLFHGVSGSTRRAQRMAVHESVIAAGLVVGSTFGGMVYEHWGMSAVYVGCAGVLVATMIGQAILVVTVGAPPDVR